jgi:hypothetical protein
LRRPLRGKSRRRRQQRGEAGRQDNFSHGGPFRVVGSPYLGGAGAHAPILRCAEGHFR